jgi:hypothetical protein
LSQIIYTGPLEGVVTPDGTKFPRGVPIDVAPELAAALLLQTFAEASAPVAPAPIQPAASFTAPAAVPDAAPPAPVPDAAPPAPLPDPIPVPAPVPDQGPAVLAPVSGVTA